MWDYVLFNVLNAGDVDCNNIDMTRFDRVDRSPPNHHQKHVQKYKPSIVLSEDRMLEMISCDHETMGQHVDSP